MLRGSAYVLAMMILGEGLGLIMLMIVGNFYSVSNAGLLVTLQNNLFLFGTIGSIGLGTCFHRFAPKYLNQGEVERVRGLQRWVFMLAGIGLPLLAAAQTIAMVLSPDTRDTGPIVIAAAGFAVVFWGVVTLNRQFMRAMRLTFWSELSYQALRQGGGTIILLGGALWSGSDLTIVMALLVPLAIGTLHDLWRIRREVGPLTEAADLSEKHAWQRSAAHFAFFHLSRVVLQRIDLFLISALLGLEEAAVYGVTSRLALLVIVAVDPIQSMFQPRVTLHLAQENNKAIENDVIQGALWIGTTSLAVSAVFAVSAQYWLSFFGDIATSSDAVTLLYVHLVGYFVLANGATASSLLLMTGNEKKLAWGNMALVFLVYPLLLALGVITFDLIGVAIATAAIRCLIAANASFLSYLHTGFSGIPAPTRKNLEIAFGPVVAYILSRFSRRD